MTKNTVLHALEVGFSTRQKLSRQKLALGTPIGTVREYIFPRFMLAMDSPIPNIKFTTMNILWALVNAEKITEEDVRNKITP